MEHPSRYALSYDSHSRGSGLSVTTRSNPTAGTITSVITGANGSGKSSVYRSLRLLADTAQNAVVASLAREGGLPSTFWAGPETIAVSRGSVKGPTPWSPSRETEGCKPQARFWKRHLRLQHRFGLPLRRTPPSNNVWSSDPHVKRESASWHGSVYRKASALVDRRNDFVWLATTLDEEPVMLTQHLSDTDSMLASVADPQRAPEMLALREACSRLALLRSLSAPTLNLLRGLRRLAPSTPVLHHDGSNLAAALQTILEIRSDEALATTLEDAFPGSRLFVEVQNGRF